MSSHPFLRIHGALGISVIAILCDIKTVLKEDISSKHRHEEAFVAHLSTGEEEVVLGGLQRVYLREVFKSVFPYTMKSGFRIWEVRVYSCLTLRTLLTHFGGDITKLRQNCFGFHLLKGIFLHFCHYGTK